MKYNDFTIITMLWYQSYIVKYLYGFYFSVFNLFYKFWRVNAIITVSKSLYVLRKS